MSLRLTQLKCSECKKNMIFEISIGSKFILVCRQFDCKYFRSEDSIKNTVDIMLEMEGLKN